MIRKLKLFFSLIILILLYNCSFDRKSGIWDGYENEKRRVFDLRKKQNETTNFIKIYFSENPYNLELNPSKDAILSNPKKNISWETSNLNLQNSVFNLYLTGIENNFLKKKIGKDKFESMVGASSPIFFSNSILFADDVGNIFNVSNNGKINWKTNIYKKLYKKLNKKLSFSFYKKKIYVADNVGFIYSINSDTGELIWIKNHEASFKSKIKVYDEKIFLVDENNKIICFNSKDGSKIWIVRSIASFIKTQSFLGLAVLRTGNVIALTSFGDLIKINSSNGTIIWTLNTTASTYAHAADFFKSSDVVISNNDVILSTSKSTLSFNVNNGYLNWSNDVGSSNLPIVDKNNVFVVSDNGYFINIDKLSGKSLWSINLLKVLKVKNQETKITGFVLGSNKIYATTLNGYLIVCSAINGNIEYFKKISNKITTSPIINNGSMYLLTEKSKLLGFN